MAKLRTVATALGATILRPYFPASDLYRLSRDLDGLQVDFMGTIHGVRSFAGLKARATSLDIAGTPLLVASLADVIASKRAARRPQDLAVLGILEAAHERAQGSTRRAPRRPRARE